MLLSLCLSWYGFDSRVFCCFTYDVDSWPYTSGNVYHFDMYAEISQRCDPKDYVQVMEHYPLHQGALTNII